MSTPIIAVFGLSGVGKSWPIGRYAQHASVLHVQGSQLLREAKAELLGETVTSDDLRRGAVLDNQALLIQTFGRVRKTATTPIIFDGHCVVDDGIQLLEIPAEVIANLAVSHLVLVEGPPKLIIQRRQNDPTRVRPSRTEDEIFHHQQRAKFMCGLYHQKLGLPLDIIAAGDEKAFAEALSAATLGRG